MEKQEITFSWEEYFKLIKKLAIRIKKEFIPSQIICIARGGLIPGLALSELFKSPLAIVAAKSYGVDQKKTKKIAFSRNLAMTTPGLGSNVLLVDDLTETGETFKKTCKWLVERYGDLIKEIKTAVIWHKETSKFIPDFFATKIKKDKDGICPWILQPHEKEFDPKKINLDKISN